MLKFIREEWRFLAAGFLLSFTSCFGQTYFISLFSDEIRSTFQLTHGGFGEVYMIATLCSAATLFWAGKLADEWPLRILAACVFIGLSLMCLAMAHVSHIIVLGIILYGLRLFGQGLPPHIMSTAMAKWYAARRGLALSLAGMGMACSEAVMPFLVVLLGTYLFWQDIWLLCGFIILLVLLPAIWTALGQNRSPKAQEESSSLQNSKHQWTRTEVTKSWVFYALLSGVMAQSAILTAVFFHQVHLVELKGWSMEFYAANFAAYAGTIVLSSLVAGPIVDRLTAHRILPLIFLPQVIALLSFALTDEAWSITVFMVLSALSQGFASITMSAAWAEIFGTKHLGSIKAMASATMVFGSSLGPPIMGWMLDADVALSTQFHVTALYMCVVCGLYIIAQPTLKKLAKT